MSNHIDQIFKQRLAGGSLPVSDDMWSRLEPFLPEARKRDRGAIFWLLGTGVVLVAAALLWWSATSGSGQPAPHVPNAAALLSSESEVTAETAAAHESGALEEEQSETNQTAATNNGSGFISPENKSQQVGSLQANRVGANAESVTAEGEEEKNDEGIMMTSGEAQSDAAGSQRKGMPFLMLGNLMLPEEERQLPDPTKDCYDFGRKNSAGGGWFAEIYGGPTYSLRSLSSRNEDVSSYIAGRDSTESSRVSWHAGLRAGYVHGTGISVRLGAHYTAVNELFDYFDGSFTQTVYTFDTIRDMSGNIIDIIADTLLVQGKRIKTTHNRYHTIDIPLLIGYQASSNHWSYGIQAGPVFNVAFWKKGDILSPVDGMPVEITDDDPAEYPAFKDQLGLSIYASAHLGRRIGYRTVLFAEPHLHYRLRSLTLDSYPVDQKQTNIGLSLGLRYMLN